MFALSALCTCNVFMYIVLYTAAPGRCVCGVFMRARPCADQTSHIGRGCPPVAVPKRRTRRSPPDTPHHTHNRGSHPSSVPDADPSACRVRDPSSVRDPFVGSLALLYSNHADLLTARARAGCAPNTPPKWHTVHAHAATPSENESTSRSLLPLATTWPGQPHPQAAPEAPAGAAAARL